MRAQSGKDPWELPYSRCFCYLNGVALAVQVGTLYSHPNIGASFSHVYLRNMFPGHKPDAAGLMLFSGMAAAFSLVIGSGLFFLEDTARWGLDSGDGLPFGGQVIVHCYSPGDRNRVLYCNVAMPSGSRLSPWEESSGTCFSRTCNAPLPGARSSMTRMRMWSTTRSISGVEGGRGWIDCI